MGRRQGECKWGPCLTLLFITVISCSVIYFLLSPFFVASPVDFSKVVNNSSIVVRGGVFDPAKCCRGIDNLELWGRAIKWGSHFKVSTAQECCQACKSLCNSDGSCPCNSWVFCGDKEECGEKFGECWLKKQKDPLSPETSPNPNKVPWTSGLIYGKNEGIIALETKYGSIRMKLLPECAPLSVNYILQLPPARLCAGCHFYRAEKRGKNWDTSGKPLSKDPSGPPYGLLQGILEAAGVDFNEIPKETCPEVTRGAVAWVGGGPDFFISLANHREWGNSYTVFAVVIPEDMFIVEKIVNLPTKSETWDGITVSLLKRHVNLNVKIPSTGQN